MTAPAVGGVELFDSRLEEGVLVIDRGGELMDMYSKTECEIGVTAPTIVGLENGGPAR